MHSRQKSTTLRVLALLLLLLFASISAAAAQDSAPVADHVTVQDQSASPDGAIVISEVVASQVGWVVLHRAIAGIPGPIAGMAAVPAGLSTDVTVVLDMDITADTLFLAVLYIDEGEIGVFNYLTADAPVRSENELVSARFVVHPPEVTQTVRGGTLAGLEEIAKVAEAESEATEPGAEVAAEDTVQNIAAADASDVVTPTALNRFNAIAPAQPVYRSGANDDRDERDKDRDSNDHRTVYPRNEFSNSNASHNGPQRACPPPPRSRSAHRGPRHP